MNHRPLTTALTVALVAGTTGIAAAPATATPSARVRYADLDLASAAGQRTLALRISSAASKVCPSGSGDLIAIGDCRRTALDQAHAELARAGVSAN